MPDSAVTYRPSVAEFKRTQRATQQRNTYSFADAPKVFKRPELTKGTMYKQDVSWNPNVRRAPYARSDEDRAQELRKWALQDINFWETRNTRFRRDQNLFFGYNVETGARHAKDAIILPDPKILVKKVARLIARHPNQIDVPPAPGVDDPSISQRIENWLYLVDQNINQKWMNGLNNPYRYDQAQSLLMRGWLAERTLFNPKGYGSMQDDPSSLYDHQVIDPALVYPYVAGNKVVRVSHSYATTIGELYYDPILYSKEPPRAWSEMEASTVIHCHAIYWQDHDGAWWHAVLATPFGNKSQGESEFLKKPTEIGYNPWTITVANGVTHRQTPWETTEYVEHIGTGILDESADLYAYINRMATKMNELLSLEANPPAALYVENGQIKTLDLSAGARNLLTSKDDRIELLRTGPRGDTHQILWNMVNQRLERASIPAAFFSEMNGESPFSAAVLMSAGKDMLFPFVEAINYTDAAKYRKMLELYRDFGPSKKLRTYLENPDDRTVSSAEFDAKDIKKQGTVVNITREDMTPQEYGARVNLGLAMLARDSISMETFRREYAKIKNPRAENRQIIAEKVYMSEDVIKALIPAALDQTGMPELRKLWEATQNPTPPEQQLPDPGMMGNLPGLPAMPPNTGMPPQLNNMLDPNAAATMDPMLQMIMNGGAMGGTGMGGVPPITSNLPAPPLPPFFRPQ